MGKGLVRKDGTLRGVRISYGKDEAWDNPHRVVGYCTANGYVIIDGEIGEEQSEIFLTRNSLIRMLDEIVSTYPEY